MKIKIAAIFLTLSTLLLTAAATNPTWNREAAAKYLDDRETWWQNWPRAQKDHGTVCISCHTQVPYAMARPGLRHELNETAMTPAEKAMRDSVEKRVADWDNMAPFYSDEKNGRGKTEEARSTEVVLNAVILASFDASQGHLRPITRKAFDEAWALQDQAGGDAGSWLWQNFHLGPWEGEESRYYGTAIFMLEALNAPDNFAAEPETRAHLNKVRDYLRANYALQPVANQLYVLWASAKEPDLLPAADRPALLAKLTAHQQPDGGWRTTAFDQRKRTDNSAEPVESDGFATGLTVLALKEIGTPPTDKSLQRGLAWLATHQQKDGTWTSVSINKAHGPEAPGYLFMTDAATAYAVLALEK